MKWLQPFCIGGKPDERLFSNQVQEAEAEKLIQEIVYQEPIRRAAKLLSQRIKQRDGKDPDSWLELGIAHAALAEYEESKNALEEAIKQDTGATGLRHVTTSDVCSLRRLTISTGR